MSVSTSAGAARAGSEGRVVLMGVPVASHPVLTEEDLRGSFRRVTVVGEEVLHRPCAPVAEFGTERLRRLVHDMFLTNHIAEGAGLAANQVGVDLRLFVYDCLDDEGVRHVGHICNPVLDPEPDDGRRRLIEEDEGCLSVPGARHCLARAARAVVRGSDADGRPLVVEGTGYFARCLQHETDHLNGMLYVDRLSSRQRRAVMRQMEERREAVFARREERATALAG